MADKNKNHSFSEFLTSHKTVFRNDDENHGEKVFTSSYTPSSIWHREEEMKILVSYFKSIITNPTSSSRKVVLYGPVGTGKTVISYAFGKELSDYLRNHPLALSLNMQKRCMSALSLLTLLSKHGSERTGMKLKDCEMKSPVKKMKQIN